MSETRDLRALAARGAAWGLGGSVVRSVLTLIVGIILARILTPSDFGLVGLAMILVGFGRILADAGIGQALVQSPTLSPPLVRASFTYSTLSGIATAVLAIIVAPLASVALNDERVTQLVYALSSVFVLAGLGATSRSLLKRELNFKSLSVVDSAAELLAGLLAVVLAVAGYGVWALVGLAILRTAAGSLGTTLLVRHPLKPSLRIGPALQMLKFGAGVSLASVINYFATQIDYLITGRVLGAAALGLYARAYQLMKMPQDYFTAVVARVLFPAVSLVQDDQDRVARACFSTITFTALALMPLSAYLCVFADEVVVGLFGSQWIDSVAPFRVLALFAAFRGLYSITGSVLKATGHVLELMVSNVVYAVAVGAGVLVGILSAGLVGAALGVGLAILLMFVVTSFFVRRVLGSSVRPFLKSLGPGTIVSLITLIVSLLVKLLLGSLLLSQTIALLVSIVSVGTVMAVALRFLRLPSLVSSFNELLPVVRKVLPPNLRKRLSPLSRIVIGIPD